MSDEKQTIKLLHEKIKKLEESSIEQTALVARLRRSEDMGFAEERRLEESLRVVQRQLEEAHSQLLNGVQETTRLSKKLEFLTRDYTEAQDNLMKRLNNEEELRNQLEEATENYQNLRNRTDDREIELVGQLHDMNKELVDVRNQEIRARSSYNRIVGGIGICPICRDNFNAMVRVPKVLMCGHSLCAPCLERTFEMERNRQPRCPVCRNPITPGPLGDFPTNYAAMNLGMAAPLGNPRNDNYEDSE